MSIKFKSIIAKLCVGALGFISGILAYLGATVVYLGTIVLIAFCTGGVIASWVMTTCNICAWILCIAFAVGMVELLNTYVTPALFTWALREPEESDDEITLQDVTTLPHSLNGTGTLAASPA